MKKLTVLIRALVTLYVVFTAALVAVAVLASGLFLPVRLPLFARVVLDGGAVVFAAAAWAFGRKAARESRSRHFGVMTAAKRLAIAYRADFAKRLEIARLLESADEEIAKAALATFQNALGAAQWVTEPCMTLGGQVPIEFSSNTAGKAQVLRELRRIDYNLPP